MNRRERNIRLYALCMFLVMALLPVLGMSPAEAPQAKPALEITGFYTEAEGTLPSSFSSLASNAENISIIAPFYYRLDDKGGVEKWDGVSKEQITILTSYAQEKNVKVLVLIHNLLYGKSGEGKKRSQAVLKDHESREHFAGEVTELVAKSGFDGVMLDIEDIRFKDRDKFSALVKQVKENFADRDLIVAVSVPPETGDLVKGSWAVNFDYGSIGKYADRVVVMAYDEHGYPTKQGPIASREWVERVVKYSTSVVPREKIVLGVPAYGFDWKVDKPRPHYLSYDMAKDLANSRESEPVFSHFDGAPNFTYKEKDEEHQVWYEDRESFEVKAEIARKHGLKGLAIWRLGMEDTAIWDYIGSEFSVRKEKSSH